MSLAVPSSTTDLFQAASHSHFADAGGITSAEEWHDLGEAVAQGTVELLGPGSTVALEGPPCVLWSATTTALLRAGVCVVPIPLGAPPFEVDHIVRDSGALLHLGLDLPIQSREGSSVRFLEARTIAKDGGSSKPRIIETGDETPALILYTSGTTGRPKGVPLTRKHLHAQIHAVRSAWGICADDVLLHCLPTHHLHGLVVAMLTAVTSGASIRFLPKFDAAAVLAAMPGVTLWMGVPTMFQRLVETHAACSQDAREAHQRAARSLRLITSGSAALPASLAEAWANIAGSIPLERYGMTEIGIAISNPLEPAGRIAGAVGRPIPAIEARIVDEQGTDCEVMGELWVRGPGVFSGYLGRPADTRSSFREGGYFATGDMASRDGDGVFRLHGRLSVDILKTGGEKVSALEIEQLLLEHPSVREVAVVGIPDVTWGDRVVAVVVANGSGQPALELKHWLKARLAAYKVPKEFVFWESLPRNTMGKALKPSIIRALIQQQEQR